MFKRKKIYANDTWTRASALLLAIQNLDLLKKMNLNFAISLNNRNEISYFAF